MTKNIFFTFLVAILGLNTLMAQALTITPSDSVYVSETVTTANDEVVLFAYVHNDSIDTVNITWRILENISPSTWNVSYCDNTNCLDLAFTTISTFELAPDSTSILKMAYIPSLNAGSSDVEVQISIAGVPSETSIIKYKADVESMPTGIKDFDTKTLSIVPNPSTDFIRINGLSSTIDVQQLEIFNVIGKKVFSRPIASLSDLQVHVGDFNNGVYLIKLFDQKREVFYTKTFIKK